MQTSPQATMSDLPPRVLEQGAVGIEGRLEEAAGPLVVDPGQGAGGLAARRPCGARALDERDERRQGPCVAEMHEPGRRLDVHVARVGRPEDPEQHGAGARISEPADRERRLRDVPADRVAERPERARVADVAESERRPPRSPERRPRIPFRAASRMDKPEPERRD
jgi:hypothetical protein